MIVLIGFDKLSAKIASERVPELCFVLVSLGRLLRGLLGIFVFHHKTNKLSFQLKIAASAVISIVVLLGLARGR